nr:MAG TPA: tail assembly protein [Caudoviricetes sp.]
MKLSLKNLLSIYRNFLSYGGGIERAEISLLDTESNESITFPVIPADLPEVSCEQKNEVFESVIGDISTIGLLGLRTVSISDLLCPNNNNKYPFAHGSDGQTIINFINSHRLSDTPFRLIICRGDNTYVNMLVVIDNFTYRLDNVNDYYINIDFKEYRKYNNQTGALES